MVSIFARLDKWSMPESCTSAGFAGFTGHIWNLCLQYGVLDCSRGCWPNGSSDCHCREWDSGLSVHLWWCLREPLHSVLSVSSLTNVKQKTVSSRSPVHTHLIECIDSKISDPMAFHIFRHRYYALRDHITLLRRMHPTDQITPWSLGWATNLLCVQDLRMQPKLKIEWCGNAVSSLLLITMEQLPWLPCEECQTKISVRPHLIVDKQHRHPFLSVD